MKSLKTILSLVLAISLLFCLGVVATFNASAESVEIAATDARVRYTGHWTKDDANMKGYFQSTIEVRFTGTSLQVKCNRALAVKIDGSEYEIVNPVNGVVDAASGLAEGEHKAILIISTPIAASNGPTNTTVSGFVLDSGAGLLYPDAAKHIAFIGDSITMGYYGDPAIFPEGVTFTSSIAKNYAAKTAMALGMVPNGTAIGGHGIEQANSTAIDTIGMSERYFRLGGMYTDANETAYDTNFYTPDYVVVSLGTNGSYDDTSAASTQVVYENMLKNQATRDPLTSLYNRRYYSQLEKNLFLDSSILMIDIDNFKRINDTYGHYVGDKVIQMVASIISKNCRNTDIPIRYGGEEFVLILNGCNIENAYVVADKIRKEIEKSKLTITNNSVSVTASIGVSLKKSTDSLDNSIQEADMALYESKKNGKNMVTVFQNKKTIIKQ